ncbi:MAG: diguanylate cyclase [bacterium]|nr:diguanylate cyclase [bacterium]
MPGILKKALLVEEEAEVRNRLKGYLNKAGYLVLEANHGSEALAILNEQIPDIIISDAYLSSMSSMELCRRIREKPLTAVVPFVLLMEEGDTAMVRLQIGADDYILKSASAEELIVRIQAKVERFRTLRELVHIDSVTQLYSRYYFDRTLADILKISERYHHDVSLSILDIDDFKEFNDTFGHQTGDFVIRSVARFIRDRLREVDIVARYGGDEFVVVMPETSKGNAAKAMTRIQNELGRTFFQADGLEQQLKVSISFGIANYPTEATTDYELIHKADQELYAIKNLKSNGPWSSLKKSSVAEK